MYKLLWLNIKPTIRIIALWSDGKDEIEKSFIFLCFFFLSTGGQWKQQQQQQALKSADEWVPC